LIVCCALTLASSHVAGAGTTRPTQEKPFYMGVYIYEYRMAEEAKDVGQEYSTFLESHLKRLKAHGVNAIYLGGTSPQRFDENLRLAEKYGMKLIPQLDFVYFRKDWTEDQMDRMARTAGMFIRKYINHPQVLAWSVKEEVNRNEVDKLARYYVKILEYAPEAEFHTLHNNLGAAKNQPVPDPVIMGTDRYGFWWEFSGGGYLASPNFALDWTRKESSKYYAEAARRGADFMLTITQGGWLMPAAADALIKHPDQMDYPPSQREREKLSQKALAFAEDGRMGWRKFTTDDGEYYNVWKWYRLPKNCMKALAWTSVLEGARLFFCWMYDLPRFDEWDIRTSAVTKGRKRQFAYWTLAGRDGMESPELDEFAEAAKEIRAYERIITRMWKRPGSPIKTGEKYTYGRAFSFPGMKGTIVVIQNSNVGSWPHNSRYFFKDSDQIRIDDEGNFVDYVPFNKPMDVHFSFVDSEVARQGKVYDIKSGKELVGKKGKYTVPVMPGSGILLFIGPDSEARQLVCLMK